MKILFLQKRLLFPPDTGGKIRTLNVLRHLACWHEITYLCNVQPSEEDALQPMRDLGLRLETIPWRERSRESVGFYRDLAVNLYSRFPFNVNKDFDPRLRSRAKELLDNGKYDLVICDFVQMARNIVGLDGPPKVLFQHNVEAEIFQRHAQLGTGWLRRRYMNLQWRKMKAFEAEAGRQFDGVIAVSRRDGEIFENDYGWRHIHVIDTAVDCEYFMPQAVAAPQPRVVFVGSMDWLPNEDGVIFFVNKVWPLIRQQHPDAVFDVVGRDPTRRVRQLGANPGVNIVGTVADIRPHLATASVCVVPLLVGGGTRLKIFEAMAAEKAIVSTTLGAEGLPVEHERHLLIADAPDEFARAVSRLLADNETSRRLASAGRDLVVSQFSAKAIAAQFARICEQIAAKNTAIGANPQSSESVDRSYATT